MEDREAPKQRVLQALAGQGCNGRRVPGSAEKYQHPSCRPSNAQLSWNMGRWTWDGKHDQYRQAATDIINLNQNQSQNKENPNIIFEKPNSKKLVKSYPFAMVVKMVDEVACSKLMWNSDSHDVPCTLYPFSWMIQHAVWCVWTFGTAHLFEIEIHIISHSSQTTPRRRWRWNCAWWTAAWTHNTP